jgi:hypothetical protein
MDLVIDSTMRCWSVIGKAKSSQMMLSQGSDHLDTYVAGVIRPRRQTLCHAQEAYYLRKTTNLLRAKKGQLTPKCRLHNIYTDRTRNKINEQSQLRFEPK